jgi:Zn-dependent oligopeptidase
MMMASAIAVVSCNTEKKEQGNPFFAEWNTPFGVPPFDQIENEHYLPAIDSGIVLARLKIAEITGNQEAPTFANTVARLTGRMSCCRGWSMYSTHRPAPIPMTPLRRSRWR